MKKKQDKKKVKETKKRYRCDNCGQGTGILYEVAGDGLCQRCWDKVE